MATPAAKTAQLLAVLWERNLPVVEERLALLENAIGILVRTSTLAPQLQIDAANVAHKLAGTLGMFGYPRGTELARMMEEILELPDPLTSSESQQLHDWLVELKAVLAK
ncbi:MAG TPA: Hpt domain-containing protein [Acidobacteriaceae bacterium]